MTSQTITHVSIPAGSPVTRAQRVDRHSNILRRIAVGPDSYGDAGTAMVATDHPATEAAGTTRSEHTLAAFKPRFAHQVSP